MHTHLHLDPFLSKEDAQTMVSIAESFGSFGTYADEATSEGMGEELPQRFDVGIHYIQQGLAGSGNEDPPEVAASRTNYFRETYAYGNDILAPGITPFMAHPALKQTASDISGCSNIVPAIVYANLLTPGQELAIHTDVPEFRGASRKIVPQWLLVVMLHSGLFDRWRVPIVTCVSWFGEDNGSAFTFYPAGANGTRKSIPAQHNSAILVDADKVFHGVERVASDRDRALPRIGKETRLQHCGESIWSLCEGDEILAQYDWAQIRYSISWKAYCFENDSKEATWRSGADELSLDTIVATLEEALRERGVLTGPRPAPTEFALMLADTFITFPGG